MELPSCVLVAATFQWKCCKLVLLTFWIWLFDIYNIYILEIEFFFTSGHQIDLAIGQTHLVLSRPLPNGLNCQVMPTPEMQKSCEKIFHISNKAHIIFHLSVFDSVDYSDIIYENNVSAIHSNISTLFLRSQLFRDEASSRVGARDTTTFFMTFNWNVTFIFQLDEFPFQCGRSSFLVSKAKYNRELHFSVVNKLRLDKNFICFLIKEIHLLHIYFIGSNNLERLGWFL